MTTLESFREDMRSRFVELRARTAMVNAQVLRSRGELRQKYEGWIARTREEISRLEERLEQLESRSRETFEATRVGIQCSFRQVKAAVDAAIGELLEAREVHEARY